MISLLKRALLLVLSSCCCVSMVDAAFDQFQVIGVGQGRTGTESLRVALNRLGVGPTYHMSQLIGMDDPTRSVSVGEMLGFSAGHNEQWLSLAENVTSDKPLDWTFLLQDYQSMLDFPAYAFFPQLLETFPNAKVILTTRQDGHSWWKSVSSSFCRSNGVGNWVDFWANAMYRMRPYGHRFFRMTGAAEIVMNYNLPFDVDWTRVCRDEEYAANFYDEWNAHIRKTVPSHRLLEFRTGVHGYAELAKFLKVPPVLDEDYPHVNSTAEFEIIIRIIHVTAVLNALLPLGIVVWLVKRRGRSNGQAKSKTS